MNLYDIFPDHTEIVTFQYIFSGKKRKAIFHSKINFIFPNKTGNRTFHFNFLWRRPSFLKIYGFLCNAVFAATT